MINDVNGFQLLLRSDVDGKVCISTFSSKVYDSPNILDTVQKKPIRVGKVISVDTYTEMNAPKVFRKANTKAIDQNAPT